MSFLDKVKGVAENAVSAVSDAASAVGDKSKEISEKSRLNKAIKTEELKITGFYNEMGQKLFRENKTAPAGYETQFAGISSALAEIEKLKKALEMMEAGKNTAESALSCPNCGVSVERGQQFCRECGTRLAPASAPVQAQQPVQNNAAASNESSGNN